MAKTRRISSKAVHLSVLCRQRRLPSRQSQPWRAALAHKKLYKDIKEKMGTSDAMRPIAQPGETIKKGIVSSKIWNMLQSLFDGNIAVVPSKRLLASASGSMSEPKAKKLAAELK